MRRASESDMWGDEGEVELNPHLVGVAASDSPPNRRLLVIADAHRVPGLRVDRWVGRAWTVTNPGLDDEIGSNRGGVVPQVVLRTLHLGKLLSHSVGPVLRPLAIVGDGDDRDDVINDEVDDLVWETWDRHTSDRGVLGEPWNR